MPKIIKACETVKGKEYLAFIRSSDESPTPVVALGLSYKEGIYVFKFVDDEDKWRAFALPADSTLEEVSQ